MSITHCWSQLMDPRWKTTGLPSGSTATALIWPNCTSMDGQLSTSVGPLIFVWSLACCCPESFCSKYGNELQKKKKSELPERETDNVAAMAATGQRIADYPANFDSRWGRAPTRTRPTTHRNGRPLLQCRRDEREEKKTDVTSFRMGCEHSRTCSTAHQANSDVGKMCDQWEPLWLAWRHGGGADSGSIRCKVLVAFVPCLWALQVTDFRPTNHAPWTEDRDREHLQL